MPNLTDKNLKILFVIFHFISKFKWIIQTVKVAYLEIQRRANFRWPLVLTTKGGPNYVFLFYPMMKKNFLPRGAMATEPLHVHFQTKHNLNAMVCSIMICCLGWLDNNSVNTLNYHRFAYFELVIFKLIKIPPIGILHLDSLLDHNPTKTLK